MIVTVTFDITTADEKQVLLQDEYLYIDIEVTDEEYEKIGASFDSDLYRGMYEDTNLADICGRCREAIRKWQFEETYGNDILFRFDYPIETRADHAKML